MTTLTIKFGGTSVGSAQAHRRAAAVVLQRAEVWDKLVVVISATSGVTNSLVDTTADAARAVQRIHSVMILNAGA